MKSILQEEKECYVCGRTEGLQEHHCFPGKNRKTSEANGFKVWLCLAHHTGSNRAVDGKDGGLLALTLKKHCQMEFEKTHTRAEFMALIGRNYL